jgi:hypothetical protein
LGRLELLKEILDHNPFGKERMFSISAGRHVVDHQKGIKSGLV